jgi:hypothetical protein
MSITGSLFDQDDVRRICERLETVQPDAARLWGRMTAHQAICHQIDALEVAVGRRKAQSVKPPMPPFLLRLIALRLPFAWPKGVQTVREADQEKEGTPPTYFMADRVRLDALIEEFSETLSADPAHPHPIFGPLSRANWGRWAYRHSDHHLRQFGA